MEVKTMPCFFPDVPDVRSMAYAVGKWNGANQLYLEPIFLAKMDNMRWLAVVDVKTKSIGPPSQGAKDHRPKAARVNGLLSRV
jgi:hypothetical protein